MAHVQRSQLRLGGVEQMASIPKERAQDVMEATEYDQIALANAEERHRFVGYRRSGFHNWSRRGDGEATCKRGAGSMICLNHRVRAFHNFRTLGKATAKSLYKLLPTYSSRNQWLIGRTVINTNIFFSRLGIFVAICTNDVFCEAISSIDSIIPFQRKNKSCAE